MVKMHMMTRTGLAALLAFGLMTHAVRADAHADLEAKARAIHDRVITVDPHVDIPLTFATDAFDPASTDAPLSQVDLARMEAGGLDAVFFVAYAGQEALDPEHYAAAMETAFRRFAAIRRMADRLYPDRIEFAETAADVRRINAAGKKVALIGVENGYSMGGRVSMLETMYDLGARYFGFVHNGHNQLSDSAVPQERLGDEKERHGGLSDLGRAVIEKCNELGLMIDVSHASKAATLQAAKLSKAPIIASHSSVQALRDHPRNMDDETLLAMKENGGVVHMVALGHYLTDTPEDKMEALGALRQELGLDQPGAFNTASRETLQRYQDGLAGINEQWPSASVSDFVDHIDYAVKLIGIDHVGVSSDFQGGGGIAGWRDASETFNVTLELVLRGYTEEEIAKIWGGNILRVMEETEKVAAR